MPLITAPPPPPAYDRDDVVREITAFYTFLTKMYLPSGLLRIPPPEGWSGITLERYAWLKKTPRVNDLMRHLPYISRQSSSSAHEIYPVTAAVDYEGEQVRSKMRFAAESGKQSVDLFAVEPDPTSFPDNTSIPEYMLVLASETSGADGYWWLLDTERGTVTLCAGGDMDNLGCAKGAVDNQLTQEGIDDSEKWRKHPTWRVEDFFGMLKEQYRRLELIPQNPREVANGEPGDMDDAQKRIFENCGWPDVATYSKDECMARMEKLMDEYGRTGKLQKI